MRNMSQSVLFSDGVPYDAISACGQYRYLYGERWWPRGTTVLWIMFNPSTGTMEDDDATIRKCRGFARRWQCSGFEIVNLFALRSRNPKAVQTHHDPIGPENDAEIIAALNRPGPPPRVIAAWGTFGFGDLVRNRVAAVAAIVRANPRPRKLEALRLTVNGHPYHPLFVPYSAQPLELPL